MHSHSKKEWENQTLGPLVRKHGERRKTFVSESGIEQDPIFTPDDLNSDEFDYHNNVGYPGEYPFVRGIKAAHRRAVEPRGCGCCRPNRPAWPAGFRRGTARAGRRRR